MSDSDEPRNKATKQHGRVYRDEIDRLREIGGGPGHLAVLYAIRLLGRDDTTKATEPVLARAALISERTLSDRLEDLYASGVLARVASKRKFGGRKLKTIRPVKEWKPIPDLANSAGSTRRRARKPRELTSQSSLGDLARNVVPEHGPSHLSSQVSRDHEGLAPSGLRPAVPASSSPVPGPYSPGGALYVEPLTEIMESTVIVLSERFPEFRGQYEAIYELIQRYPDNDAVYAAKDFVKKIHRIEHPGKALQLFESFLREARRL